jgi:sorbitol-specific phosphotransferase system component IIC
MASERKEGWFRILALIISGIVLGVWAYLIWVIAIINFLITIFSGKRNKGLADFCEQWNTEYYRLIRYLTFVRNERPFPFTSLAKKISNVK